jgi:Holliday junction resolvase RusA-like endonuclease
MAKNRHVYSPKPPSWDALILAMKQVAPSSPLIGPLHLEATFVFKTPRAAMDCRPDLDNLEKLVMDAATQAGWWVDDCQVICKSSEKLATANPEDEGTYLTVRQVEQP